MSDTTHDFGPWLELPELAPVRERRCRNCSAKRWLDGRGSEYGNDASRKDCR